MYRIPYGKRELTFDLPETMKGTLVESRSVPPLVNVEKEIILSTPVHLFTWSDRETRFVLSSRT
jgi:hypothetical protein